MRIAFVAPFGLQPKGTVSARMVPLAHALARRGHSVRIVIPPWDDPAYSGLTQPDHLVTIVRGEGRHTTALVDLLTLPLPRRAPYTLALTEGLVRGALWSSPREARGEKGRGAVRPQVVHVFKPIGYSGFAGLVFSAMRVPWVLDTDDWEGPGGWADINPYSRAQKAAVAAEEALLPRLAGAVTAASRTLEARAWTFGLPRKRVFYLPNGVAPGEWPDPSGGEASGMIRRRHGLGDSPTLLLYTRFAEFPWSWPLDVFETVAREMPSAKLLVVGNGFFGEEREFEAEAARRGLNDRVVVVGRVPEDEVPAYLGAAHVALYPMLDTLLNRAKSPVKVLEPMLAGVPLVAHRVGQAAEFVGDAGVLVEPGNLEGMAVATLALLADPSRAARLGRAGRERVRALFNWDRLAATAEKAYRTVIR